MSNEFTRALRETRNDAGVTIVGFKSVKVKPGKYQIQYRLSNGGKKTSSRLYDGKELADMTGEMEVGEDYSPSEHGSTDF